MNVPATGGFKGDEATYYMMGHSLAADGDLAYRHEDLERTWKEYPSGPAGRVSEARAACHAART